MSEIIDIGTQTAVGTLSDSDRLLVQTQNGLHPVSFADLAKAVRETVKVGGRNLLRQSIRDTNGYYTADGKVSFSVNRDSYFKVVYAQGANTLKVGKTYTLSFDCEGMGPNDKWNFTGHNGGVFNVALHNGRCSTTFVMSNAGLTANDTIMIDDGVRIFPDGMPTVTLSNFMLEEGNVASAFRYAPEDPLGGGKTLHLFYNISERRVA